jgi:hypothetical protein
MINRLPKEFRLPAPNGVNGGGRKTVHIDESYAERIAGSAARCIGRYPVAALSAAFVVGLIFGRVVKR